jgi:hypothetical protein
MKIVDIIQNLDFLFNNMFVNMIKYIFTFYCWNNFNLCLLMLYDKIDCFKEMNKRHFHIKALKKYKNKI